MVGKVVVSQRKFSIDTRPAAFTRCAPSQADVWRTPKCRPGRLLDQGESHGNAGQGSRRTLSEGKPLPAFGRLESHRVAVSVDDDDPPGALELGHVLAQWPLKGMHAEGVDLGPECEGDFDEGAH